MSDMCSSSSAGAMHEGCATTTLSDIHSDILETHVLRRLHGPALASFSCTSSQLYKLSSQHSLWTKICNSTWPSTATPTLRRLIASFERGHRSFFSDCFPSPVSISTSTTTTTSSSETCKNCTLVSDRLTKLISAVDLCYRDEVIISRVVETETVSGWFRSSPFRVDLLHPKDVVFTPIRHPCGMEYKEMYKKMEDDLRLSWILVDPMGRRAMNVSSGKVVSVKRYWLTGEVHVRFSIVLGHVTCDIVVTCGECIEEGRGELMMQVREVSLQVEDLDGVHLNGEDSLEILGKGMKGKRGNWKNEEQVKRMYMEFLERKCETRNRKLRREGRLDSLCVSFGILVVGVFWMLIFFK